MRYEVNENNEVYIYDDGVETPFCFQPNWPDNTPWADKAEAEMWAQKKIAELTDPDAPVVAIGPTHSDTPKPTAAELLEFRIQGSLGMTVEQLKAALGISNTPGSISTPGA